MSGSHFSTGEGMTIWIIVGLMGQFFFSMRFISQWIRSERLKRSHIPIDFWYLSILGSILLLIYAIRIKDPVFILGQSFGSFIYLRNLVLIRRGSEITV